MEIKSSLARPTSRFGTDDAQLVGEYEDVTALALHPAGDQLVAVGTEDGEIELWSLERGERVGVIDGKDIKTDSPRSNVLSSRSHLGRWNNFNCRIPRCHQLFGTPKTAHSSAWITKTAPDAEFKGWNPAKNQWPATFD